MDILGYIELDGEVMPYVEKDENGYGVLFGDEMNWYGARTVKEVDAPVLNEFEKAVYNICIDLAQTLISKNRDYGDSYSKLKEEYGDLALIIRQSDKLERLKTLQKQGNLVNESKADTKKDGAGYYILDLAYERVNKCSS